MELLRRKPPKRLHLITFLVITLIYLGIACFFLSPEGLWSPDEGAKLLQIRSLRWENDHLAYDIQYGGREIDPDLQFAQSNTPDDLLRINGGRLYFQRLPIFPLLVLPLFHWLGLYGLYVIPAVSGALVGLLALLLLKRSDRKPMMWVLITLGSPVLIYSVIFWEHTLATGICLAAAVLAIWLVSRRGLSIPNRLIGWGCVGIGLGASVYIRQEAVIFGLALLSAYWLLLPGRRWEAFFATACMGLVLLPFTPLHRMLFSGQVVPDNANYLFYPFAYIKTARYHAIPDLLIGPNTEEAIESGWLGGVWTIAALGAIALNFGSLNSRIVNSLKWICLAVTGVAAAVFLASREPYRSAHGLLFTTPWALVGLCRGREIWRNADWRVRIIVLTSTIGLIGYVVAILVFRASSPQGGLEWGARFAMPFYPLLAILTAWDWDIKQDDVKMGIVLALVLLGLGFQLRGLGVLYTDKKINAELNRAIMETNEQNVVTDLWWLPYNAAPLNEPLAIFVAVTPQRLAYWVHLAGEHQLEQFTLVTLNPALVNETNLAMATPMLNVIESRRVRNLLIASVQIGEK